MQRYHVAANCSWPMPDGEYVLRREAQAEIARLQADVVRLTEELTASCARAEMQQREAERLRRNSSVLHDTNEKIFAEGAKQLARADTAWNDAIEAAAQHCEKHMKSGGCAGVLIRALRKDNA